jgi:hypothetical protein
MKKTFLFLVAFLLSFNSFSQYVVTRTDTIFGKVISGEFILGKLQLKIRLTDTMNLKSTYDLDINNILAMNLIDPNLLIGENNIKLIDYINEINAQRNHTLNNTIGKELIKYGKLNNIASGLEVVGYVTTGVGGVTFNPPIMIVGGVVYLISWIVRTSSYKHVIEAGKISDGYYKNAKKPIQIIQ